MKHLIFELFTCTWGISNLHGEGSDVSSRSLSPTPNGWRLSHNVSDSDSTSINVTKRSNIHDDVLSIEVRLLHGGELEGYDNDVYRFDIDWFGPSNVDG